MISFADLFAGGGGTSTGAFGVPGIHVSWALNHSPVAIKTHAANHPETKHYQADIRTQNVKELEPVDIMWASLECTEHSKAKGGKDKNEGSFTLGWELHRYIKHCNPLVIYIENVPEFIRWGELKDGKRVKNSEGLEYLRWIKSIKDLGYDSYERRFLNAADYGCPTRRVRYFGVFTRPGIPILWPQVTHAEKENMFGIPKWIACKDYINLTDEGVSIFGRAENELVRKGKRHPLSENTLRRIAGGIRKFAPEVYFIMKYYGNGDNCQSIAEPLHTIRTKESHTLITCEKLQFVQDHCHTPNYNLPEEPLRTQLTRQTKQLITVEKKFLAKYFNGKRSSGKIQHHCQSVDAPAPTIRTVDGTAVVTAKAQFYTRALTNNYANQPLTKPAPTITTFGSDALVTCELKGADEKFRFISTYFNSGGNPETQNRSVDAPLGTILSERKHALVTAEALPFDFDIKMRFLTEDELASIMGFPEGYFKRPGLKLSKKEIVKLVGNAVPVGMAKALLVPLCKYLIATERVAV